MTATLFRPVAILVSLIALSTSCSSTQERTPAPPTPPAAEALAAPVLVWEVTSSSGEQDYILVRPPVTAQHRLPNHVFRDVIENADASNALDIAPPLENPQHLMALAQLPEGQRLADVVAPETASAVEAWKAEMQLRSRGALFDTLHPAIAGALAWLITRQKTATFDDAPLAPDVFLRRHLRRIPRPQEHSIAMSPLVGALTSISTADGEAILRTAVTAAGRQDVAQRERAINAAFAAADIDAYDIAVQAMLRTHPLYVIEAHVRREQKLTANCPADSRQRRARRPSG